MVHELRILQKRAQNFSSRILSISRRKTDRSKGALLEAPVVEEVPVNVSRVVTLKALLVSGGRTAGSTSAQ